MLDTLTLNIGKQVVRHATSAWLGHRKAKAERSADLADLVGQRVTDQFSRRKLTRQLEDIGDQIAHRLNPLVQTEIKDLPANEREAALAAVVDALTEFELTDDHLFAADLDATKLARAVRDRVPAAFRAGLSEPAAALYDLVLDKSCICLVSVIQQLPAFQPRALTELLSRFSTISDQIEQVLQRLPRTSLDAPRGTEHDAEFTRRYLAYISETMDELELFGVDIRRYRPRTSVSVAYLGLTVTSSGRLPRRSDRVEMWPDDRSTSRSEDGLRVELALATSPRVLLRGQAGSGKTTLLQWIAVNASRGSFTGSLARWNGAIPFFVRLRSYPEANLPQPETMLTGEADPIAGQAPEGWAHRQFHSGNALLLVDGVDELRADRRPRVRKWLSKLLTAFPKTQVVVTSRPSAAEANWLKEYGFGSLLLEPMSTADITVFCRRWHRAIREWGEQTGGLPCPVSELDDYEATLLRHFDSRRHLRTLATNPLLCAMLCALNLDRRKQLPPDRMRLYEAALELLIDRRDAEREVPASQNLTLDTKSKVTILHHLAWWLTLNGRAEATISEAEAQVELAINRMPDIHAEPSDTLQFLLERSGVIREPVAGRVDFVHRTFLEYLAGKHAADEHQINFLVRNAHLDQWRETVIMGAGHAAVPLRDQLLTGLLDRADKEPRHARRLHLVAAACLETTHTVSPIVAQRVETALDSLIPPRRRVEARSLTVAGDRLLRRLPRDLSELTPASAAACVRAAALTGGPDALNLLARYAPDPRPQVQTELANVWKFFPAEQYAKSVLAHAPLNHGAIEVEQMEHIRHLRHLNHLRETHILLRESERVENLDFLANVPCLVEVNAEAKSDATVDLRPLAEHRHLRGFHIFFGRGCSDFDSLAGLPLINLSLPLADNTCDLDVMPHLENLWRVSLDNCAALQDCSALTGLSGLRILGLWGCVQQSGKNFLSGLESITNLSLGGSLTPASWAELLDSILPHLKLLNMCCRSFTDLNVLAHSQITDLWIQNSAISDLSPLSKVVTLRRLMLSSTAVTDLSALKTLPNLNELELYPHDDVELDLSLLANSRKRLTIGLAERTRVRGREAVGRNIRFKRL